MIKINKITKTFKNIIAVNDLSLEIPTNQFIAILGPNGAGKTTLVEMIEGIQKPTHGEITINDKIWHKHENELKKILGICLQETQYMEKTTVKETIDLFQFIYKTNENNTNELISQFGLNDFLNTYVLSLSGGQRQKLSLLLALINNPKILILDEPTTGLDPNFRREIWDLLLHYKKRGLTLLLTTHYMEEADLLCDKIIMMNHGKIVRSGSKNELLSLLDDKQKIIIEIKEKNLLPNFQNDLCSFKINWNYKLGIGQILVNINEEAECVAKLINDLKTQHLSIERLEIKHHTLEDVFIKLTGETLNA